MSTAFAIPATLQDAIIYFSDLNVCHDFMTKLRFPNSVACVHCGSLSLSFVSTRRIWQCKDCKKQFSVKVGTIFEDSALPLSKWLPAFWMLANTKNGTSSCELARSLGVTQKTAWFMLHRIRHVMNAGTIDKMSGDVEADETYIGGIEKNKHSDKKVKGTQGRSASVKAVVMGIIERSSKTTASRVKAKVIPNASGMHLKPEIKASVYEFSNLYTDAWRGYNGLSDTYIHRFVDHAICYAIGQVHTNGIENFWALLKRMLKGTYVAVEPFHLEKYLDEMVFRFNNRKDNDAGRFLEVMNGVTGRRLTYETLIASYESYYDAVLPRE